MDKRRGDNAAGMGEHQYIAQQRMPLRNENCVSRPPVEIKLQKGWNKIVLKLPVGKFTSKETRLVKWMFSATLTE